MLCFALGHGPSGCDACILSACSLEAGSRNRTHRNVPLQQKERKPISYVMVDREYFSRPKFVVPVRGKPGSYFQCSDGSTSGMI
jgi:hypothetical protein